MDDIARQLPDPPPARPAARAATIAAALAKFDGVEAPTQATAPRPARWSISRSPVAAFASVVVVALIAIPLALLKPNDRVAGPPAPVALDAQSTRDRPAGQAAPAAPEAAAAAPEAAAAVARSERPHRYASSHHQS